MTRVAPVTGFSHVQLLVTDVATSERWYSTVLGLEPFASDPAVGYVALRHRPSGFVVVLTERDGEAEIGGGIGGPLDHIAFAVPDRATLQDWADHLTTCGIEHPGIVLELGKPSLQLRDPDGTSIELVAPPARQGG